MNRMHLTVFKSLTALALALTLSACFLSPYKLEVRQGNYLDQDMLMKLKPDMTKDQVTFILGTPLVIDPLTPNNWNYVYLSGAAGDVKRERTIVVVFEENLLKRLEGDVTLEGWLEQ
jgi:outer membrane protein assembly factor BamE